MKQLKLLLTLLTFSVAGVLNMWAATETLTISGASSGNNAPWNGSYGDGTGTSVTSGGSTIGITYTQVMTNQLCIQIKKNNSNGFYSTTFPANSVITSIAITSQTNSVTLCVSKDGENWGTGTTISKTTTQTYLAADGYLYFKVNATSKYAQIASIVVTYETATASCTTPTFTIEDKTISLSEASNMYDMSNQTIDKDGSTGTITYSCSDGNVDIDGNTFHTETAGTYTVNATMAADATYCEATTTFTITVQSAPCTKLSSPSGLSVGALTAATAELSWQEVTNAAEYQIVVTASGGGEKTYTASSPSLIADGLTAETAYSWTVQAIGDGTTYCDSDPASGTSFTTVALPKCTLSFNLGKGSSETIAPIEHTAGAAVTLPAVKSLTCPDWQFAGWAESPVTTETTTAPTLYAGGFTYTTSSSNATLYAVYGNTVSGATATASYGWEESDDPSAWTINNFSSYTSIVHKGSNSGSTNAKTTGDIQYNTSVLVSNVTFYASKATDNEKSASWIVETSTDQTSWSAKQTYSAASVTQKQWTEYSTDITTTSPVYVRIRYNGNTAVRLIDDITITYNGSVTTYTSNPSCKPTYTIILKQPSEKEGTIAADKTSAKEGEKVTLSYTENAGYYFSAWSVMDEETVSEQPVVDNVFTMPASAVEVSATFEPCTQLPKPANLSVSNLTATTAQLSWTAIPNASKYHIHIIVTGDNIDEFDTEDGTVTTYTLTGLNAKSDYLWTVKALGDGHRYCDSEESESGEFTTEDYKTFTISWIEQTGTSTTSVTEGSALVLPTTEPVSCDPDYSTFIGWYTTQHGTPANPTPDLQGTKATETLVPTGDMQFYAVFGASNGGITTFTKITSEPSDWNGEYILVYEATETQAYVWTGVDEIQCYVTETIDQDKIVSDASLVVLKITADGYIKIQGGDNNGLYIGQNNDANGIKIQQTGLVNTISHDAADECVKIVSSGGAYMRYNANSGQDRFRYYKSTNYTGQKPVQLYKKTSVTGSSSGYISVCKNQLTIAGNVMLTSGYTAGGGIRVTTPLAVSTSYLDADAAKIRATCLDETGVETSNSPFVLCIADGTPVDNQNITTTNQDYLVSYTPANYALTDKGTIRFELLNNSGDVLATTDLPLQGHSLPEQFVIAAETANGWVALPADLSSNSNDAIKSPYSITVDNAKSPTLAQQAPSTAVYTLAPRSEDNTCTEGVRFRTVAGTYLQGSTAANTTKVWLSASDDPKTQVWQLSSNDFVDYLVRMNGSEEGRYLSYDKTQKKIANYKQEQVLRFLPVETQCTRFDAPELQEKQVKSTSVVIGWKSIAGATEYEYSLNDQSSWTDCTDITDVNGSVECTVSGFAPTTKYTVYVRVKVTEGTNCSEEGSLTFTTSDCDDVPYDLAYTSDQTSVTVTWKCDAVSATVILYSDPLCTNEVERKVVSAKTCTFSGLPKNVVRYVKVLADGTCASEVLTVQTEAPVMDVVEWDKDHIDVVVNTNEKISVVLENEVTKQTGQDASDIFFSKYFEAAAEVKLLAIYNGTKRTIDLSNVRIEGMAVTTAEQVWNAESYDTINLSPIGSIASEEEIVLYSLATHYDSSPTAADYGIADCIQDKIGFNQKGWYPVGDNTIKVLKASGYTDGQNLFGETEIATGGDKVFRLIRTDDNGVETDIDIIGAAGTDAEGNRTIIQTDDMSKPTNGDKIGWTCDEGVEYEGDPNVSYQLSTNRHLLIRKNSVVSGANAIATNTDGFHTLCTEWTGRIVPKNGSSGDTEDDITCNEFDNVLGFDYNKYYTEYVKYLEEKTFDESSRNPDGTITIDMPADKTLDKIACSKLKIIVKNSNNEEMFAKEFKVPIIVDATASTDDAAFFGEQLTEDVCKACDVVVRDNATLSVVDGGKNTVRDIMVYQGSELSVPQGKEYTANSLSLRRREQAAGDEVASLNYQGTLNLTHSSEKAVYLDILVSAKNWHFLSLPYDCAIDDVTYSNGKPAVYGTDWFLMYYDGARRASTQQTGSNWRKYEGTVIEAGKGYVVGIKGSPDNEAYIYELRFPMAKEVLTQESTDKQVPVNAYGAGTDIRPNHKGWNLVGNPYLNHYKKEGTASFQGLVSGLLVFDEATGYWSLDAEGERNHPYITIPQNFGWTAYNQVLASETPLSPFTCYFLQVTGDTNGEARAIEFTSVQRGRAAMPMLTRQVTDEPVIVDVALRNAAGEQDHTALVIDDRFTDAYEMDADFFKWFGDYYRRYTQPVVYTLGADGGKRAFNAVSETSALSPVSVGYFASHAGEYTFSLNRTSDLARVAEVWLFDAQTGTYTNLLQQDYTFTSSPADGVGRFTLNARLLPKVITGVDNLGAGDLRISSSQRIITVSGLPSSATLWLYDATGKLISSERTSTWQRTYTVPQSGTYFLRVETLQGANTLSTVIE